MNLDFPSVYDTMNDHSVLVKNTKISKFGYIMRTEEVNQNNTDNPTTLEVCYSMDGMYLGNDKTAEYLCDRLHLTQFETSPTGNIARIGFSESEQKWYGWSHRATYGFGIGSTVKKGDCAYIPSNKEDMLRDMLEFWDIDKTIECESADKLCTKTAIDIKMDYIHRNESCSLIQANPGDDSSELIEDVEAKPTFGEPQIGIQVVIKTEFHFNRKDYISTQFEAYPAKWGGEWTAITIEDAKQMAINFAEDVS